MIPLIDASRLTEQEQFNYLFLNEQSGLEAVSAKMELFRQPYRIKIAHGGRGAGAKSWGVASLLIQRAYRECLRICCFREVQKSLEESSYRLMVDTIARLRYGGWKITKEALGSSMGSHIIFRGLSDMRAADQMKSLEGYDIFWLEEASAISKESISILLPTLRKPGSELWATLNRDAENDPIIAELWNAPRDDVLRVELKPGKEDNPWFPEVLQKEMEEAYKNNEDEALHVWGGQPRKQGDNAILSRVAIKAAMERAVVETEPLEAGVDVARFGNDKSEMYFRKGAKIVNHQEFVKKDTQFLANAVWDFVERNPKVIIKVDDTGIGGGVTDRLRALGANVIAVNFGGSPKDKIKYTSVADEMWFELPVDEISIPNDQRLMEELSGRLYTYDKIGRRKVEPKEDFRKRYGRSPDKADALLLAFYTGYHRGGGVSFAAVHGV
jgi:phage terminase large subunit